jgi:hypothetical protein
MNSKAVLAVLCALLLVYVPGVPAATPAAVGKMNTTGPARINGLAVPTETTVFAGDRIATEAESNATLALAGGGELELGRSSEIEIQRSPSQVTVLLQRGAVAVLSRGDQPVVTQAGGARIHPAKQGGSYIAAVHGNALRVIAQKGTADVEAADRTVGVNEGKALEAEMMPAPQVGATTSGLSTFAKIVLIAGTAASFTGLGLGVAAITRSNPQDCTVTSASTLTCP